MSLNFSRRAGPQGKRGFCRLVLLLDCGWRVSPRRKKKWSFRCLVATPRSSQRVDRPRFMIAGIQMLVPAPVIMLAVSCGRECYTGLTVASWSEFFCSRVEISRPPGPSSTHGSLLFGFGNRFTVSCIVHRNNAEFLDRPGWKLVLKNTANAAPTKVRAMDPSVAIACETRVPT